MKNKIYALLLALISALSASAQEEIARIPVEKKSVKAIRKYIAGDSIVLAIDERISGKALTRHVMIGPDGTVTNLNFFGFFDDVPLIYVESSKDSLAFYYMVEPKQARKKEPKYTYVPSDPGQVAYVLRALMYSKATGNKKVSPRFIELTDDFVSMYIDDKLNFITSNKKNAILTRIHIHDLAITAKEEITLPAKFFDAQINSAAVIQDGIEVLPWQAEAALKFYVHENSMDITKDESNQGTTIVNVDFSSSAPKMSSYFVPDLRKKTFGSYYHNGLLYRAAKHNGFDVTIFDSATQVNAFRVSMASSYKDSIGYLRATDSNRVFKNRSVWDTVDNTGAPFISVFSYDSANVLLKLGTHKRAEGGGTPILLPYGGVIAATVAVVMTTAILRELTNTSVFHTDHYFHMMGSPASGFKYWNKPFLIGQYLDKAEMFDPEKPVDYFYKVYIPRQHETIAVYYNQKTKKEKKDPDFLRVVKYVTPR